MLAIPGLGVHVVRASMLGSGAPVAVTASEGGITLVLPPGGVEEPDRVIVLETARARGRP
jgi:hypothetical protein